MKRLSSLLTGVSAVALFAMMVLTFADVFARKFLPNSITGAVELTELMMMVMIYFALPLASIAGEHIVFDLLDRVVPQAVLRWQHRLSHALTALIFGGAAWLVWSRAMRTLAQGDQTSALEIKIAPYQYMAAVMLALTALMHAWLAWRAVAGLKEPAA
ncbi:MAG: TRAP transporter small permease [Rubrivivax sp.]|jgi:TRAP-type C4-dicarboxylate transport system permease small subunit|nr:TRAP transporter small permease [Rubrivivax sp.]